MQITINQYSKERLWYVSDPVRYFWFTNDKFLTYPGDEGGEGEDLEEATLKLQPFLAKAERSHLIVWQVMVNEDWPLFWHFFTHTAFARRGPFKEFLRITACLCSALC